MTKPHTLKRTLTKAVSWEITANVPCLWLAWFIFGNFGGCVVFTLACVLLKILIFIPHENIWHSIRWGKTR